MLEGLALNLFRMLPVILAFAVFDAIDEGGTALEAIAYGFIGWFLTSPVVIAMTLVLYGYRRMGPGRRELRGIAALAACLALTFIGLFLGQFPPWWLFVLTGLFGAFVLDPASSFRPARPAS